MLLSHDIADNTDPTDLTVPVHPKHPHPPAFPSLITRTSVMVSLWSPFTVAFTVRGVKKSSSSPLPSVPLSTAPPLPASPTPHPAQEGKQSAEASETVSWTHRATLSDLLTSKDCAAFLCVAGSRVVSTEQSPVAYCMLHGVVRGACCMALCVGPVVFTGTPTAQRRL